MFSQKLKMIVVVFAVASSLFISQVNFVSASGFSDVPTTMPYAKAVYDLAERNIIGGYEDGTFKPGAPITRGQAAAIIAKAANYDTKNVKDPGFKDVPESQWSYGAIAALANAGVINGYGNGRFGPNDTITRAQMASILVKAFRLPYFYNDSEIPFTDTKRLSSHQTNINILYIMGITSGTSPTTFSPNSPISRAQAAVLITKTEKVKASTILLKSTDFGWSSINRYSSYTDKDDVIHSASTDRSTMNEIQLIPRKKGTTTFTILGKTKDPVTGENSNEVYRKYYAHVIEENGQLTLKLEQTEDILPTESSLKVKKDAIDHITLATIDGEVIQEEMVYSSPCKLPYPSSVCFTLDGPGEYIATVHYVTGEKVPYTIVSSIHKPSFNLSIRTLEEKPTLTMQVGYNPGKIGEHRLPKDSEKIAEVTREKNSDIFHMKGITEGRVHIQFPNSTDDVIGLYVFVDKVGSFLHVTANLELRDSLYSRHN